LLQPVKIDKFTGYRYYSASQMPKLNRILSLKEIGFTLDEISLILDKNLNSENVQMLLELKQAEITEKIKAEQERLLRVENLMKVCKQEAYNMNYDIVLKNIEPIKVASLRSTIPNYGEQGPLWDELGEHIRKHGVKMIPPCMAIYHDTEYREEMVDAEVVEPIIGDLPDTDRIKSKVLDGVNEMATIVHQGPFQTLHLAYNAISKWIEDNKYEIVGPQRELYLKGDWMTDDPKEYITEIQFPVRKINS
jgi:effector-binding domain-containing protein